MAGPHMVLDFGYKTGGAIRQFRFVALDGSETETVEEVDTAGARALGVSQENVTAEDSNRGRIVNVRLEGISRCIAGAALTEDDLVAVDNQGRVVTAAAGNTVVGRALQSAAAAGDHVDVLLTPVGPTL